MGTYRYFLAVLVLLSHADARLFGFNLGVAAVISFFLISGYVMTLLIETHYKTRDLIGTFYLDRSLRLFPQFLFWSLVTLALAATVSFSSRWLETCTAGDYAMNFAMLPIGYFKIFGNNCYIIPPAWSLGLELTFYIVFPLALLYPRSVKWLALASFVIFSAAYLGVIHTDLFSYRLLPGTLFMFLVGAAIATPNLFWPWQIRAFWIAIVLMFAGLFLRPDLMSLRYNKEVLLGLIVGIPALIALTRLRFSKFDELAGNLSYGVFLCHFVFVYIFRALGIELSTATGLALLTVLASAGAYVSYMLVELPALRARRAIRGSILSGLKRPAPA